MSETTLTTWHQTIDFNSLMVEARKHITELAGELWTDHNSSDPGITQLEVLAFCIADLSYRTSFDVKDILAGYKGGNLLDIDLPLADVALPNAPVTINDLRKVLIDMPNPDKIEDLLIRNVYPTIVEGVEVPFYAVSKEGTQTQLSYKTSEKEDSEVEGISLSEQPKIEAIEFTPTKGVKTVGLKAVNKDLANTSVESNVAPDAAELDYNIKEILVNGLYGLQVEFEDQESNNPNTPLPHHLKDLNQNYFEEEITVDGQVYTLSVLFPYWDEINWQLKDVDLLNANTQLQYRVRDVATQDDYFIAVDKLNYDDYFYDYYAELDLNGHTITAFIKVKDQSEHEITVQGKPLKFRANFLDWNELSNGVLRDYSLASPNPANAQTAFERVRNVSVGEESVYDIRSKFTYQQAGTGTSSITREVYLLTRITFDNPEEVDVTMEADILYQLQLKFAEIYERQRDLEKEIYERIKQKSASIYQEYLDKINAVFRYLYGADGIWSYLGKYRNLCEDYAKFSASRVQEIALFGKILASPGVNPNQMLGEIYYRIDEFLDPLIRFHTLSEMSEMGHSYQDIFNGPLLSNGFILNEDLKDLKRRSVVYTSDLIRIIMDVPGVLAVEDFNISSYIDNRLMGRNVINCLNLTKSDIYKPRFSADKTKMVIYVDDAITEIIYRDVIDWYHSKLAEAKAKQRPNSDQGAYELNLPTGQDRHIESYRSIQHDFPEIYGIGEFGLPMDADEDRKSRAKQLKAFLLPFEQLLANYLKQVAHLPELFSYSRNVETTYATQPLYEVPDVQPLFSGFVHNNVTWDAFKQDIHNSYATAMRQGESEEDFRSRRNRFLSQLIARFGESFAAYAGQMFDRHKHLLNNPSGGVTAYLQAQAETLDKLIGDKITFGEEYEQVSSGRYNAFDTTIDYSLGGSYLHNIGNYKRRLCRLLGIEQVSNANVFGAGTDSTGAVIDLEGMHIVEHVLLRPRTTSTTLLPLLNRPLAGGGSYIFDSDKDPYSFRITIVLPLNAGRFESAEFRNFTERLIRMETPAHIGVDFKWLPRSCGKRFEEAYIAWKKAIYLLKPWYFQHSIDAIGLPKGALDLPSNPGEFTDAPNIILLKNSLIQTLSTPCKAKMELFNAANQSFTANTGVIRFEEKTTDVFHIRVSHPGGKLSIFAWDTLANEWKLKVEDVSVSSYNSVDEYTGSAAVGLTEYLGGVGRYRVSYAHADFPTLDLVVEVTSAPTPVKISIGNKSEYLNFDTETDGVFKRSNKNWGGYFLEFMNYSVSASITITGNGFNQEPITIKNNKKRVLFSELYEKFGAGKYRVAYSLDGESTFAEIELYLELTIHAFQGDVEQLAGSDKVTLLDESVGPTNFTFDVPKGSLSVTDLDGVLPVLTAISIKTKTVETSRSKYEGQVIQLDQVDEFSIDIAGDDRFVADHRYLFEYTKEGYRTTRVFKWVQPQKEEPTLNFLLEGNVIEDEVVMLNPKFGGYSLSLSPEGYDLTITTADGELVLQMDAVKQDDTNVPLHMDHLLSFKTNSFKVRYGDDTVSVDREFSVLHILDPVVDDLITVTHSITETTVGLVENRAELIFEFNNPELFYTLKAQSTPGKLTLVDEDDNKQVFEVPEEGLKLEGHFLHSDTYSAKYDWAGGTIEFILDVINPNPTFELQSILRKQQEYTALAIPLKPFGKTYIWRVNGKYVSRAKQPSLTFDFKNQDVYEVRLTLHYEELEPSYTLKVTEKLLQAWMNEK